MFPHSAAPSTSCSTQPYAAKSRSYKRGSGRGGGGRRQDKSVPLASTTKPSKDIQILTVTITYARGRALARGLTRSLTESFPHHKGCPLVGNYTILWRSGNRQTILMDEVSSVRGTGFILLVHPRQAPIGDIFPQGTVSSRLP